MRHRSRGILAAGYIIPRRCGRGWISQWQTAGTPPELAALAGESPTIRGNPQPAGRRPSFRVRGLFGHEIDRLSKSIRLQEWADGSHQAGIGAEERAPPPWKQMGALFPARTPPQRPLRRARRPCAEHL